MPGAAGSSGRRAGVGNASRNRGRLLPAACPGGITLGLRLLVRHPDPEAIGKLPLHRRAGRAAKTYRPTNRVVQISIPPRQHAILAEILLDSVLAEGADVDARQVVLETAAARGRLLGQVEREQGRPGRLGAERALSLARSFVARLGFEPAQPVPGHLVLRNCPFQPLAARSTELVCGINHAFLAGFLEGLGTSSAVAVLEPQPDTCCVELRAAGSG